MKMFKRKSRTLECILLKWLLKIYELKEEGVENPEVLAGDAL